MIWEQLEVFDDIVKTAYPLVYAKLSPRFLWGDKKYRRALITFFSVWVEGKTPYQRATTTLVSTWLEILRQAPGALDKRFLPRDVNRELITHVCNRLDITEDVLYEILEQLGTKLEGGVYDLPGIKIDLRGPFHSFTGYS